MKRLTVALLIITLLLTGCASVEPSVDIHEAETSSSTESTNLPEPSHSESITIPEETSPAETTPPVVDEDMPSDTDMDEEGEKDTPAQSTPQNPTEDTPATKPAQPDQGEAKPTPAAPEPTEPTPTEPKPTPTTPTPTTPAPSQPSTPSTTNRPTSSATCRDTGSDKIWEDPKGHLPDNYEETDPDRAAYLEYLVQEGNPYFYWLQEEEMRMYLGRNYGMPLYTSYEMMMASAWTISDPSVATINQLGFVVPLKEGEATVTVNYVDPDTQEQLTRECVIYVEVEPVYTFAELEQMAKNEAKAIADYLTNEFAFNNDLELIAAAATVINTYVGKGHTTSLVPGYNQPFGTLITGYSSCAGSTRALGLVLEYLGFEWYHTNENQWSHQWCVVYDVDGQTAFADGSMYGIAGYGERLEDQSNWMQYSNGTLQPFA